MSFMCGLPEIVPEEAEIVRSVYRLFMQDKSTNAIAKQLTAEGMENDAIAISGLLFELTELQDLPISFNEKLWNAAIDRVMVFADERVVFHFKDGKDITRTL